MLEKHLFDTFENNDIYLYRLSNKTGAYAEILNYGGIIRSVCIPDKDSKLTDVVVGFDKMDGYLAAKSAYYGALVGRYANRIKNSEFTLNNVTYRLNKNNGYNHLHGGLKGFDSKIWDVETSGDNYIKLSIFSKHMEENYPGNLHVSVTYTFDDTNTLSIKYEAFSDMDTILNMTNHAYFNLNGHNHGYIGDHYLKIYASNYTPTDDESIPTGDISPVEGTVFDFREYRKLHEGLVSEEADILSAKGYDHNFVLDKENSRFDIAASAYSDESGIYMDTYTDMPGIQLYSGNYMELNVMGKDSYVYKKRDAFCLETQFYPDSIHHPEWPQPILKAGDKYCHITSYKFYVKI